jgi:hypothetical protein
LAIYTFGLPEEFAVRRIIALINMPKTKRQRLPKHTEGFMSPLVDFGILIWTFEGVIYNE